jgi:SpoVK/Ycf46/Vps4 family AAA+-type ATPase
VPPPPPRREPSHPSRRRVGLLLLARHHTKPTTTIATNLITTTRSGTSATTDKNSIEQQRANMLPSELKLTNLGHCYVHLPETFVSREPVVKGGAIISIRSIQNDFEIYAMWNGQLTAGEHLELDCEFAKANGLEAELVIINTIDNLKPIECTFCCAELINSADYTILSQHSDISLLDTCRLINRGLVVPVFLSEHVRVLVRIVSFQPDQQFGFLNKWTEMSIHHNLENLPKAGDGADGANHQQTDGQPIPIQDEIPFISSALGISYRPRFHLGAVLICGDRGCGKTYLMNKILKDYKQFHSEYLNCKQLRGKRPENVKKRFQELLETALERQPSIIALDDIDAIVDYDSKHEEEPGQDVIYKKRLVDAFCYLLKQLERQDRGFVVLLSSCRSLETLDKRLADPKGRQYFNEIIKIEAPNLETRVEILKNLVCEQKQIRSDLGDDGYTEVARKCGSFMPADLRLVFERALLCACSRSSLEFNSDPVTLNIDDFNNSLDGYVPMNLRAVSLQTKTKRTFAHVGGMAKVKESLIKTVLLPIKYPKLCSRCPLKPQNSILLYGPPGCGKTLVAEALINQEGLNSICVRGPELLSKYIGASEAAVRDLFKKAQLVRPCVIFFDEFESLVARRGADSTGVTDRVVNQFLTVLDGVESLGHDVFIVAATCRPDMIDPAMLRPGRMDKHIYCPPPDRQDRLDILKVLSKDLDIEKNVDLEQWSFRLIGFTGADIQALLYSAQLRALHEMIDNPADEDGPHNNNKSAKHAGRKSNNNNNNNNNNAPERDISIVISEHHLEEAWAEMRDGVEAKQNELMANYPASINQVQKHRVAVRATLA